MMCASTTHPATGSQASAPQDGGPVVGAQVPEWHVLTPLHTLLSSQGLPSGTRIAVQPRDGSQLPTAHGLVLVQSSCVPATQRAFWQRSSPSQMLLSAQDVPFGRGVPGMHCP